MDIPVICIVSAVSGTGKTTVMEQLIARLVRRGYQVGAVKSDCHGFAVDVPGKDSWRFAQAGAQATAIISTNQYAFIQKTSQKKELDEVVALLKNVDIVLVEGFKLAGKAKIEIIRQERGTKLVSVPDELIAVVTDVTDRVFPVPVFGLRAYEEITDFIVSRYL